MARDTRERSTRRDPSLSEGRRDVVLQAGRRFYTASGNDSAVRQARALQNALGVGVEFYGEHLERKNEEGTARAVNEAAQGGERSAEDPNKGYNETFDRIEAANDLALFQSELPKMLDDAGWRDLSEEEVQGQIDEYFKGQLEGINQDSVYGKLVGAGILSQNAALLDTHRKYKGEQAQQEKRVMVYNAAKSAVETGDFNHEQLMGDLKTLLPGPGGRMTYLETVFDLAEELGMPELVESIPENFPGGDPTGVTDPNMKDLFDTAKAKAESVKQAKLKAADEAYKDKQRNDLAVLHSRDKVRADAGDATVLPDIAAGTRRGPVTEEYPDGTPPRYSEAQATALYDRFLNAQDAGSNRALLAEEYATGNAIGYNQNEIDEAHNAFVDHMMAAKPADVSDEEWQQQIQTVSLERAVANGKLPSVYKAQLSVNLSNPEKFKEAAEFYQQLEAQRPGFAETQIGPRQSRLLDVYDRALAETGGDEEQAIKLLEGFEPGRSGSFNKEVTTAVDDVSLSLANSKPGWGDYANSSRLHSQVAEEVRFYIDMGFEPEVAQQYAFEHISRRYIPAGDYLYPKDAGWGVDPQATYKWAIENEAAHRGVDPDTLTLIPTGDPKLVRFQSTDEILPSSQPVRIDVLGQDHARFTNESFVQRAEAYETATPAMLAEAEDRAYARRYPPNPYLDAGTRAAVEKMQRDRWNALPPEQKQKLITAEMK